MRSSLRGKQEQREILNSAALFIRYLQDRGVVPRSQTPMPARKVRPILDAFCAWMRSHRGIANSSLDTYQTILVDLLDALGDEARAYTPHAIRAFVLERARPHGSARAKSIAHPPLKEKSRPRVIYLTFHQNCFPYVLAATAWRATGGLTVLLDASTYEEIGK